MNMFMTNTTDRNDIEPVLFCVAGMVVVMCLFATGTVEGIWARQAAKANCCGDNVSCLYLLCVLLSVSVIISTGCCFPFFSLAIAFDNCVHGGPVLLVVPFFSLFTFFCASIFSRRCKGAQFALPLHSVFCGAVLVKFRSGFNFLASTALLWYDGFGHGFFFLKKLCLEPIAAQTVVGSLYCSTLLGGVK